MTAFLNVDEWQDKLEAWCTNMEPLLYSAKPKLVENSKSLKILGTLHRLQFAEPVGQAGYEKLLRDVFWRFFIKIRPCLYVPRLYTDESLAHVFSIDKVGVVVVDFRTSSLQYGGTFAIHLITLLDDYRGEEMRFDASRQSPLQFHSLIAETSDEARLPQPAFYSSLSEGIFSRYSIEKSNGADAFYILLQFLYDNLVAKRMNDWLSQAPFYLDQNVSKELTLMRSRAAILQPIYYCLGAKASIRQKMDTIIRNLAELKNALERREWFVDNRTYVGELAVEAREQFLVDISAAVFPTATFSSNLVGDEAGVLTLEWYALFFEYFWKDAFVQELEARIQSTKDAYEAFVERREQDGDEVPLQQFFYSQDDGIKYRGSAPGEQNGIGNDYDTDESNNSWDDEDI